MRKRIFGTQLYITFEGTVEDVGGNVLQTRKIDGGTYVVSVGKGKVRAVHKLVAEAFIGPYSSSKRIIHLDGDKSNNSAANLEYVKVSKESSSKYHYLYSSLTETKRLKVIHMIEDGIAIDDISSQLKYPQGLISYILLKNNKNNT